MLINIAISVSLILAANVVYTGSMFIVRHAALSNLADVQQFYKIPYFSLNPGGSFSQG